MASSDISAAIQYANKQFDNYLTGFQELLSIPSVSTDPAHNADMEYCADWLVGEMLRIGLTHCRKIPTAGHPVVYGEWLQAGEDKPTVLIYAHYDVQPISSPDLWGTVPFEPRIIKDRLYARGCIDDKCGVWVNLKAIESILSTNQQLPVNIKLFFEGEEELGSPNVQTFVTENHDLLTADVLVLSDGPFVPEQPNIGYAVRGTVMAEVEVKGPQHDLHSGRYGGAVHNPAHHVAVMIASFHNVTGRVQIPGFYDDARQLSKAEKAMLHETWQHMGAKIEEGAGVNAFWGNAMGTYVERTTTLPTLDVNGIWGGYAGSGTKAIIPAQAGFKVTIRTVPDQDPEVMAKRFHDHILSFQTDTLTTEVNILSTSRAFTMSADGAEVEAVQRAFEATLGKRAVLLRHGGALPIGGLLQHELGIPMTMLGFGSGDNSHAPNEYIIVDHIKLGIETAIHFLYNLAELMR